MKARFLPFVFLNACLALGVFAADEATDSKAAPKQEAPKAASDNAQGKTDKSAPPATAATASKSDKTGKTSPSFPAPKDTAAAKTAGETPTLLPPVEVKRNRLIELDRKILDLEDDIAREKKKIKSTEADKALNDARVSSALSVFGGSSSESREALARERISLMETELSLLEMADRAKTKAEKEDLQKQANDLRTMRRNLERGGNTKDSGR